MIFVRSRFVSLGTGYHDYLEPLQANIPGLEKFQGKVIHPQFWPVGLDYTHKRIVVIGSGATAITLLPALSLQVLHIFCALYKPWEQRLWICPDGDFYAALRNAKSSIVTGTIDMITTSSIKLTSGEELHPDIIVTATGYANASWTLGSDTAAQLVCQLLTRMRKQSLSVIVPRMTAEEREGFEKCPILALSATYVKKGGNVFPQSSFTAPWQPCSYYWRDLAIARWGDVRKSMEWLG
ncbi:hypothetical protein BDV41DRAFT_577593 [Aspergillus transmontanensis]|uniref:Monooxygenase n=1 Tax=Aspergillus transmontanensis TaxID=1034304 RepID=A0A5N6VWR0_9EURO|nr:hypothetical protein BDV41DRAFT_577593 [Aspergillus transmontanensis]